MNVDWDAIWYSIFGTTHFCGVAIGFWVGMVAVALVVVGMNLVEWNMSKFDPEEHARKMAEQHKRELELQRKHEKLKKENAHLFK